jgi:hypothetical protein
MEADIRKDQLFEVPMYDGDEEYNFMVSAKYDRIDHYAPLGIWILKMLDDKEGLVQAIITEQNARKLASFALLPIIERDFLYKSEHEMYIDAIAGQLDDIFGGDEA